MNPTAASTAARSQLLSHAFSSIAPFSPPYTRMFICVWVYTGRVYVWERVEWARAFIYTYVHTLYNIYFHRCYYHRHDYYILTLFACVAFRILLYIPFFLSPPRLPFSDGRAINHSRDERYSARATRLSLVARAVRSSAICPAHHFQCERYYTHTRFIIYFHLLWHHLNVWIFIYENIFLSLYIRIYIYRLPWSGGREVASGGQTVFAHSLSSLIPAIYLSIYLYKRINNKYKIQNKSTNYFYII